MNYKVYTLENEFLKVEAMDYAASIYQVYLKTKNEIKPMLSTPKTYDLFIENNLSYARTIGRTAGRVYNNEETSNYIDFKGEPHIMHGGENKFSIKNFKVKSFTSTKIVFTHFIKDLEDGYQGDLKVEVSYELKKDTLIVTHKALSSKDTLVNMTFHPYFNLDQTQSLKNHQLKINSETYLKLDENKRYTILSNVKDTLKDFTHFKNLKITPTTYLDDIFLLSKNYAATLKTSDVEMNVYTNYDALVVFSQNRGSNTELSNAAINTPYAGIAIEAQKPQNKLPLLKANEPYEYYIQYQFKSIK
ncbi:hypothetical protein [Acholeplasma granularum]|uniref:aldose epimerase family protein n=1 Tax=Acholeplasma granularum TaxID=264635 RepID=UPI00046FD4ED|nr:hypothetical protein [Acholeplasma granularum]